MHELDVPVVVAIERAAYQFPWSEGIFRDCLRVGYVCRVVDVGGDTSGYGIMSCGAGEAHILNVCIREDYRCRGLGADDCCHLLDRARAVGMHEAFLEVRPSNTVAAPAVPLARIRAGGRAPRLLPGRRRARGRGGAAPGLCCPARSERLPCPMPRVKSRAGGTFAIISHPDAGKTTLTEKLLLFGGAIQMAGTVKGRKATRHATSDWMRLEQQRGISVTSSVMQFPFDGCIVNLLDTPGHEDFSEDTYRTLTAVDSALMVIDCAKGVEERTIKLMDVCRLRDTPIMTFVNKLDRDGPRADRAAR